MANCQNKCFISLALKALEIRRKFKLYTAEKEYAKAENENADVNKCLCTKFSKFFNSVDRPSVGSVKRTGAFNRFLVEDSIENFILKSVFGFLGGILLTYICFMFLVFSLNFTLKRATYICMGLGVILSLGLAFSVKIRCTVFLCIPQLFSKRGRQALLAYAFILALSGPAKNTLHNVEVMSESLACAQEQLKQAENELLKCVHKPNAAAKKSIEKLLEKLTFAVKDFKNFIMQLYKNCFDILETVLQTQKWLYSITLLCHKKMGKPAHHCLDLVTDSIENCQSMNPMTPWKEVCKIDPRTQESICSTSATAFCMKSDVPDYLPVLKFQRQLDAFKHRAMNILYVKIEAHQTYSQSNRSYTYHEEYQGMATEIRQKTDQFLQYFDFMSVIFGIFILVLFVKVIIYRHKFLTEDHYDNRYITSDFVDIDNTRAEFQMETLLPLEPREKMQYIKVTSIRLVPCERVRLLSSFVFLIFATFKIIIHILTDSSLYWILSSVRRDERLLYMSTLGDAKKVTLNVCAVEKVKFTKMTLQFVISLNHLKHHLPETYLSYGKVGYPFKRNLSLKLLTQLQQMKEGCLIPSTSSCCILCNRTMCSSVVSPRRLQSRLLNKEEPSITVRVVGYGLVAALLRNVTRAVKRQSTTTRLDPTPCLPDPVPPDWNRYYQILALVIICWLLALCEPYGLRLRHTVMVTYHPDRARERAIWLYNRIISNRTSFVKISRREIRKKYKDVPREVTFRFQFMKKRSSPKCLLCKNTISCVDKRVECPTVHCVGVYCDACFASLKLCSICSDPADYGDLSDLSEEKDSSEEECLQKFSQKRASTPRKVEPKENKKGRLSLNFKKPNFKLKKECDKDDKKEKPTGKHLIQPTLLFHVVRYCRNKIPAFRQLKNLSDVESSDWDLESTLCADFSSVEDKFPDIRKWAGECKMKEKKKGKDVSEKPRRKKKGKKHDKDSGWDKKSKKSKKLERAMEKVCLFQKISPLVVDKDLTGVYNIPSQPLEKSENRPTPDFRFRKREKDAEVQTCEDDLPECFLTAKDSVDRLREKKKRKNDSPRTYRKCSVGVVLVDQPKLKEVSKESEAPQPVPPEEKDPQNIVCPLELDSRCSESEIRNRITFPFIDPINIHEFAGADGVWDNENSRREGICDLLHGGLSDRGVKENVKPVQDASPTVPCTPSCARVCFRKTESTESLSDSVRLCIKEEQLISSTESDCQFYSQPYRSPNSSSIRAEIEGVVKKASGKSNFNLKIPKKSAFYSIETDSSNDKFLSVKPARRAKFVRFLKKSLQERKSSEEEGSSDFDDYLPNATVFLSDEEFQRISKEITLQKTREGGGISRKPNQLTWSPGLLSELPSYYRQYFTETFTDGE